MEAKHKTLSRSDRIRLEDVKNYISTNLTEELSVQALAEKFMFSRSTLKRQFYSLFQQPISRFVFQSRMSKAYELIKEQDKSVSTIGNCVGYTDRSAFTHAFTKYYGFPPIQLFNERYCEEGIVLNEPENHKNGSENHKNEPENHS